jgi:hypothetical protein
MHSLSISHPLRQHDADAIALPGTIGVEHDDWQAEARRRGTTVIVSVTAADPRRALEVLAASDAPMDCWFKDGVRSLTGQELPTLFAS